MGGGGVRQIIYKPQHGKYSKYTMHIVCSANNLYSILHFNGYGIDRINYVFSYRSREFGEYVCLCGSQPRAMDRFACQSANRRSAIVMPAKTCTLVRGRRCLRCELVKSSRDTDDNQCFPISATSNSQPDTDADGDDTRQQLEIPDP